MDGRDLGTVRSSRDLVAFVQEDLPAVDSSDCKSSIGDYARKHAPWTNFGNLDHRNERPYSDLAVDIAAGKLPALAFVIPNNNNNTHISACPMEMPGSRIMCRR